MIDRRRFTGLIAALGIGAAARPVVTRAQSSEPEGRIAFIRDGHVYAWSSAEETRMLVEDGAAMDPTWEPGEDYLLYVRDGGSFSDLILSNAKTGRTRRMTNNESKYEVGSPDYVADSVWVIDPSWSQSGIACYASTQDSPTGELILWILDLGAELTHPAASDGTDAGTIEHISVDGDGIYAAYTVVAGGGGPGSATYVSIRDLNTGATYPLIEAAGGAYDPAISADGQWVVASLRDEQDMSDLWLCNRVEETITQLTFGEQASNATWSPDGSWIAYLSMQDNGLVLKALPVDLEARQAAGDSLTLEDDGDIDSTCGLSWNTLRRER